MFFFSKRMNFISFKFPQFNQQLEKRKTARSYFNYFQLESYKKRHFNGIQWTNIEHYRWAVKMHEFPIKFVTFNWMEINISLHCHGTNIEVWVIERRCRAMYTLQYGIIYRSADSIEMHELLYLFLFCKQIIRLKLHFHRNAWKMHSE